LGIAWNIQYDENETRTGRNERGKGLKRRGKAFLSIYMEKKQEKVARRKKMSSPP
jgi:hypothetical protein